MDKISFFEVIVKVEEEKDSRSFVPMCVGRYDNEEDAVERMEKILSNIIDDVHGGGIKPVIKKVREVNRMDEGAGFKDGLEVWSDDGKYYLATVALFYKEYKMGDIGRY